MIEPVAKPRDSRRRKGGRIPGVPGRHAFELAGGGGQAGLPVLIAVPHAGRCYPPDLVRRMRDPAEAALRLEDRFVDLVAAGLARRTGAAIITAHAPRAMIDLNRALEDMDREMLADPENASAAMAEGRARPGAAVGRRARGGLGLVPRRLPGLGEIWRSRLAAAELAARIEGIHKPYHRALGEALEGLRDRWGAALLVDLHSMPPLGAKDGPEPAPDFVIGDRFGASCGAGLAALALDHLAAAGRSVAHNRPYAGGYVLDRHAAPARGIHGLQLELCRAAYLDAEFNAPGPGMEGMIALLTGLVRRLADEVSGAAGFAEAAE